MANEQPVNFRTLAEQEGSPLPNPLPQEWPLERWFASVCDLPLEEFTVFDLARACRQRIHLDAMVPYCLRAMERTPLAGEQYDGELLAAVIGLPPEFWITHAEQRDTLITVCRAALLETDDENLKRDVEAWLTLQDE